ncbi:cofilin [Mortierella antarctica]|nr:cofilin [Mortierella antarctica]
MSSGATVSDSCLEAFNKLKLEHKYKYIVFKVSDDNKEIIVEKTSDSGDYEAFLKDLPNDDCRFAVYDFELEIEGNRWRDLFYSWAPDAATIKSKMLYTASKSAFRKCFVGIAEDITGTEYDEISFEKVAKRLR